jgi:hypothetical protein
MMRLMGSRTVSIAWVVFHTVAGPPTGTVASTIKPASAAVGTIPLTYHGADPIRRFGFGSTVQHWTGWIVAPMAPPNGAVSSAVKSRISATGVNSSAPTSHSAPGWRRVGFRSHIIPWTGRVITPAAIGGINGSCTDGVRVGSAAAGALVFTNTSSTTVVRYGKIFTSLGVSKRWAGSVLSRGSTVASASRVACVSAGTHTPIPYTGTSTAAIRCASFGTNMLLYVGTAVSREKQASLSTGALTFQGTVTSSVIPRGIASSSSASSGTVSSSTRVSSYGRGLGRPLIIGHMKYRMYRAGTLAGKGTG